MLMWDKPEIIDGLTTYRDHQSWTTFYVFPNQPRYRLDDNGNPVFKFIKYRMPVDRPDGRKGGGFLIFDVEFTVPENQLAGIQEQLDDRVQQHWRRLRLAGRPPKAKIGQLSYLRGSSNLQFLDSGGALVEKVQNPGSPSLYGKMVTPFTVELSPEGATLAEQALQDKGGVVQVAYDLWTPVRLPPVRATVWFDAKKFMEFHQTIDVEESFWGEDSFDETVREKFIHSDSGGVHIEPGAVTDRKVLDGVRDWAWSALEEAVGRMVLGDIPEMDPAEARKLYTEQDIENISIDVIRERMVSFRRTYTEGHVMEWNPAPRGTLPNITSLTGPDGEPFRWEDFATVVDLDDPFFKQLNVTTRANADFDHLPLDSVEVKIEYDQGREHRVKEFSLRSAEDVGKFATFIDEDSYRYKYSYQVNYEGSSRRYESPVMESDETFLTVNVGDTGILLVDVAPGDLNFAQVREAQVTLQYEDPAHDVPLMEQVFKLDKENPDHRWVRVIFQPREKAYRYRVKYFMEDGKEYESEWRESLASKLFVNDPFGASRTLNLRAFGDFESRIDTIFVDLRYEDEANAYSQSRSVALSAGSTFEDWTFPVISESAGKVTYRAVIRFQDGTVEELPEREAEHDTIMLGDVLLEQKISVMADLLDFEQVRLVKVSMRYRDEEHGIDAGGDLVFKAGEATTQEWIFGHKVRDRVDYEWQASYFMADGSVAKIEPKASREETLVLPQRAA